MRAANEKWRLRDPLMSRPFMSRDGLHGWIYEAGRRGGWILPLPEGKLRKMPISHDIGLVFERDPDQVKEAARAYWRHLVKERSDSE